MRFHVLACCVLFFAAPCLGSSRQPATGEDLTGPLLEAFGVGSTSRTALPALTQLDAIATGTDTSAAHLKGQLKATLYAQLGAYDDALTQFPSGTFAKSLIKNPAPVPDSSFQPSDAAATIARLAKGHRIVVVNEAHHAPQTRTLIAELLPLLRAEGFTDYSLETLDARALPDLQAQGAVRQHDGVYTREPVFSQLIRSAMHLGYRLDAHEYVGDESSQQERETGEAENLVKLLRDHPQARVLVHVGYAHVREGDYLSYRPMAAELKRLTGIDPLTIDETVFLPSPARPDLEAESYRSLLARMPHERLTGMVFVNATGEPWSYEPTQYDVSVVLPSPMEKDGRPGWLWQPALQRHTIPADPSLCAQTFPCAIAARWRGAPEDEVAADVVLLRSPSTHVALGLPPGRFILVATDAEDRILGSRELPAIPSP